LNPGSFEVAEICDKLHEDATVPSAPSSNVPKLQEPNAGKDMICGGKMKSLQKELPCDAIAQVVEAPELKVIEQSGSHQIFASLTYINLFFSKIWILIVCTRKNEVCTHKRKCIWRWAGQFLCK
jgi:hypothetical protein